LPADACVWAVMVVAVEVAVKWSSPGFVDT
jgi:hypothetical protein